MEENTTTSRRQQMFDLVESCHASGLTRKQFCLQQGIKLSLFYYWQKRYRQEQSSDAGFLPVQIGGHSGAGDIEIIYPNGVQVRLGRGVSLSLIRSLITTL